jgi:hypothetical protein
MTARYSVKLSEASAPNEGPFIQVEASALAEMPMLAAPFTQNLYADPADPIKNSQLAVDEPLTPTAPVASRTTSDRTNKLHVEPLGPTDPSPVAAADRLQPPSYAATILLSAKDSLQLYGNYDEDGTLSGYLLRYTHITGAGVPATDVMLRPVSQPIQ